MGDVSAFLHCVKLLHVFVRAGGDFSDLRPRFGFGNEDKMILGYPVYPMCWGGWEQAFHDCFVADVFHCKEHRQEPERKPNRAEE